MAIKIKKATEYSENNMTVRAYIEKIEDESVIFNIDIQRAYVWKDLEQKSALIQSLIINDIVPPFIFNKVDGIYEAFDCKQRSLTIYKYFHNEFALKGVIPIEIINDDGELEEIDINGLKYSELPDYCQNAINDYNLKIWYLEDASQDTVARNFYNLNNGNKINAPTMSRLKAKSKEEIKELASHPLFKECLSESALEGHVNEDLAVRAHAVLNDNEASTNTPWVRKYMMNTAITKDDVETIKKIFDRILSVHNLIEDKRVAKRIYGKTHLISIVPTIMKSLQENRTDEQVKEWIVTFFTGNGSATVSKAYNMAAGRDGTGKKEKVRKRLEEVEKNYNEFFLGK